jgi:O-antigen/teichoic acid export membrane protein
MRALLGKFARKPAIRQGSIVLADQGALSVAAFLTGVMVARACSKDDYGLYVLGWSLLAITQSVQRALISVPFTIYLPHLDETARKGRQGSTLIHTIALAGIAALAGLLAAHVVGAHETRSGPAMSVLLPMLAVVVVPLLLRGFIRNAMLAQLRVAASAFANIPGSLIQILVISWLFVGGRLTVQLAFVAIAIASCVSAAIMIWCQRAHFLVIGSRVWSDLRQHWIIGRWLMLNVLGFIGVSQAYPWLILYFRDSKAVASYGVCAAVAGMLGPLLTGANAYVLPRMTHGYKGRNSKNLRRLLRLSMLVLGIPFGLWFIAGSVFGEPLMALIYSHRYGGYGILLMLLLAKNMIESTSALLTSALQTLERPDITTASLLAGAMVALGLGSLLISKLGLNGVGIAAVLASIVIATWKWVAVKQILGRQDRMHAETLEVTQVGADGKPSGRCNAP